MMTASGTAVLTEPLTGPSGLFGAANGCFCVSESQPHIGDSHFNKHHYTSEDSGRRSTIVNFNITREDN